MRSGASQFLIFETAKDLQERGLDTFNLGGVSEVNPGLHEFKAGFGASRRDLAAAEFDLQSRWQRTMTGRFVGYEAGWRGLGSISPSERTSVNPANLLRYFYRVPWCVPAWGMRELWATGVQSCGGIVEGPAPAWVARAVRNRLAVAYALPVNRGGRRWARIEGSRYRRRR